MRGLQKAVAVLKSGGLVVYPTETAYALGCDATKARAVAKIYALKGRERGKPLPLIVADQKMAERYAVMTPLARKLAKKYWAGPLTLVLRRKGRGGTLALRVSSHPVARALAAGLGKPIVSTSANKSGKPACYSVRCVVLRLFRQKGDRPLFLDAGILPHRPPSTIVDATGKMSRVLRQGGIEL